MEYYIARCSTADDLVNDVKSMIKDGWKPIGGVTAVVAWQSLRATYFYQAMVKGQ